MNAFVRHLGEDYQKLPGLIQQAHHGVIHLEGNVFVRHGNMLARLFAGILKLPPAAESVQLTVDGYHEDSQMRWLRNFGGHQMQSCFRLEGDYLVENMGPVRLWMKLVVEQDTLQYKLCRASVWGVTIPAWFAPGLNAFEKEDNGNYIFGVRINLPVLGRLIEYGGTMRLHPSSID